MSTIHLPTGITAKIVGIEANSNGQACCQHDVCGTELVERDVMVRLQQVQVLNSIACKCRYGRTVVLNSVVGLDSLSVTLMHMPKHLMASWYK